MSFDPKSQGETSVGRRDCVPLLDIAGAAEYLGTSERHVRRLVHERRLEHIKLGDGRSARLRFRVDRLDRWLDEHTISAEPGA